MPGWKAFAENAFQVVSKLERSKVVVSLQGLGMHEVKINLADVYAVQVHNHPVLVF